MHSFFSHRVLFRSSRVQCLNAFAGIIFILCLFIVSGCAGPRFSFFKDDTDPLQEHILEGEDYGKILVIPVSGIISDVRTERLFKPEPSMVQEIVSQLRLAEKDKEIKAVLLKINFVSQLVITKVLMDTHSTN